MKKNKGFTLVELLAVIAILAILVIMALPAVLRMYRQARINNFQNEVRSVYRTAQSQFLGDSINLESGEKILYTNADSCAPTGVDSVKALDMTGNSNFKYYVLINVDGKVLNVRASNGTYSYSLQAKSTIKDIKIEDINVETNNESTLDTDISSTLCVSSEATYPEREPIATCVTEGCTKTAVGIELTVGGENFYVIGSEGSNTLLLSKYDLKEDGSGSYTQDTSGTSTNIVKADFYGTGNSYYWSGKVGSGLDYEGSYCASASGTNCAYVYDSNAENIEPVVTAYANKIGSAAGTTVEGKLMSLEEAYSLSTDVRKDMNGYVYWLGSARSNYVAWIVNGNGSISYGSASYTYGVRPVIIVSTSSL